LGRIKKGAVITRGAFLAIRRVAIVYFDFLANRLMPIKPAPKSKSAEGSGTVSVGEAPLVLSVGEARPPNSSSLEWSET
jgi:hypothetical protein